MQRPVFHSFMENQIKLMGDYNISTKLERLPIKGLLVATQKRPLGTRTLILTGIKPDEMAYYIPN